jgi:hypothetical protein
MIGIDELKRFVEFLSNKEQSGNNWSPEQFNLLVKRATDDIQRWLIGLEAQYAPQQPIPAVAYEVTQKVKDDLRWLKSTLTLAVDTDGLMTIPTDYIYLTAIEFDKIINDDCGGDPTVKVKGVEVIDDDKWAGRLGNSIKVPNLDFPVCNFKNKTQVQFRPKNLQRVRFVYLKTIETPVWGYTIDPASDVPLYDAGSSTDVDMPEILLNDIARIMLSYIGINLRETQVVEYSEMIKAKGV